jgi:hypothetical protein
MLQKNEIEQLKEDIKNLLEERVFDRQLNPVADSDWSAHARWKSSSKSLPGDFDLSSSVSRVGSIKQIDQLIADSSSAKLIEVAKSLKQTLKEE